MSNADRSVLIIGNHPLPFGGVPTHIKGLSSYLVETGWRVDVITPKYRDEDEVFCSGYKVHSLAKLHILKRVVLLIVNINKVLRHFKFFLYETREFIRCLTLYDQGIKLIGDKKYYALAGYHIFPSGLAMNWIAKKKNLHYVLTIFGEIYENPSRYRLHTKESSAVLKDADLILSCSQHCAKSIKLIDDKYESDYIYYGVDVMRFTPKISYEEARAAKGVTGNQYVVVFLGRHTSDMGLGVLLQSIPKVIALSSNVKFFIGGAVGELTSEAALLASRYDKNVYVSANIPEYELVNFYQIADIVVVPSINARACLGLTIIEAMLCKKPVIVSDIGGGPEVIADGGGVLVEPENPEKLAEIILEFSQNKELGVLMGEVGRKVALNKFDVLKTNKCMASIFLDQIGG